jgi:hypothetical protein
MQSPTVSPSIAESPPGMLVAHPRLNVTTSRLVKRKTKQGSLNASPPSGLITCSPVDEVQAGVK